MSKRLVPTILLLLVLGGVSFACHSPTRVSPTATPSAVPVAPTRTAVPPTPLPTVAPGSTKPQAQAILHPENLSAGDPYAPELGNRGYDVQHYTLKLALDPGRPFVQGDVTVEAESAMDRLDQVSLDFVGFEVSAVAVDGEAAAFFRQEKKLIVNLPTPLAAGETFRLNVVYSGVPVREPSRYVPFVPYLGLFQQGNDGLFVVAEPDGARYWFPANDHPRDKATYRFELTVPAGLTGVANGLLVETKKGVAQALPDGSAGDLYIWEHNYPMATAFATVAVGNYQLLEATSPKGVPLRFYVLPGQVAEFERAAVWTGEAVDWMSERFGPYPFEALGYVVVEGLGASLETQTMIILGSGMVDEDTMVHEMAHMWFGDWVSLDSWAEIWRSEGFATYVSLLWRARADPVALERTMAEVAQSIEDNPSGYRLDNPPPEEMFGSDSYMKGALVAHALRQEMGDEAFFRGLRAYFQRYGGGTASQAQFQAVMEEAAGRWGASSRSGSGDRFQWRLPADQEADLLDKALGKGESSSPISITFGLASTFWINGSPLATRSPSSSTVKTT